MTISSLLRSLTALAITTLAATAAAQTPLKTIRVVGGLARPVLITHAPGDFDRIFVIEQRGAQGVSSRAAIRIVSIPDHNLNPTPFLTINGVTTGSEQDLDQVTKLARRMVARWGMSEVVGPVSFTREQHPMFLGREIQEGPEAHGDSTAQRIDDEIKALIGGIEQDARALLRKHRGAIECLAERLLEEETLDCAEVERVLREHAGGAGKSLRAAAG